MESVVRSTTLSEPIGRPPDEVDRFIAAPRNLTAWATSSCRSVSRAGAAWIVATPHGPVGLRFVARNDLGVLDHDVSPDVSGSDVLSTLFQLHGMSDDRYAESLGLVEADLRAVKRVIER